MTGNATVPASSKEPEPTIAPAAGLLPVKRGHDTTFFMSRGGLVLRAPIYELLAMCERLIAQAEVLNESDLIPEVQKIREAASHLATRFTETEQELVPNVALALLQSGPAGNSGRSASRTGGTTRVRLQKSRVLIVDDCEPNSELVSLLLIQQDYDVVTVCNGPRALSELGAQKFDLVLLDILMPEMNGFQVLQQLKADAAQRHIPVIMLSGLGDMDSVICCIEMGAEDYLPKPFNPVLLSTRVAACLEKKHLRDHEESVMKELQAEREKSERLLLNILPEPIAARLKQGERSIAESFSEVTVLFADLAGFTRLSGDISPMAMVDLLNEIFSAFDQLAIRHGLEKIKTIGDAYMVVGGLPTPRLHHTEAVADMALDMLQTIEEFNAARQTPLSIRIGIHTGPVIAGIIGRNKFAYDLWGDTVNLASRMESQGQPGCIQITPATYDRLKDKYAAQLRGAIGVKGMGDMLTYLLLGRR